MATSAFGGIDPAPTADAATPPAGIPAGPVQTFRVGTAVLAPTVARDPATATTQASLDAVRNREAEAAALAAHELAVAAVAHRGPTHFHPPALTRTGEAIVAYARQYVGLVPYSTGASPSAGFECDGFTQWVYAAFGVALPRGVNEQAALGTPVPPAKARAGDLVVYPGEHIGIYDGRGGIIDSPDWGRYVSHRSVWGHPVFVRIP
nr:NlpC/P60 family protein [Diaminobutyricibacter tongyongensis]